MKLGANTKDTPTARWERAAEEADVVTEDTEEGRERERQQMSLYLYQSEEQALYSAL